MDACKSLHHKLILVDPSKAKNRVEKVKKLSSKGEKIIQEQENKRSLEEEEKQMKVFNEQLRHWKNSVEELEARVSGLNWPKFCANFLLKVEALKIKLLKYEGWAFWQIL